MKRHALLAVMAAIALGGCGAEEAEVLKGAFEDPITSANVELEFVYGAKEGEMRMGVAGPYQTNGPGKLPSVDWRLHMSGPQPTPSQSRLVTSPDKAFIVYKGENYEFAEQDTAGFRVGDKSGELDLRRFVGQMRDWFPDSETTREASLDGEPVTRITGKLDLRAAADDLKALGQRRDSMFAGFGDLTGADLRKLSKAVSDARFTVDVARSDGKFRRIEASLRFAYKGQTGTARLTIRLKDVDQPVSITAPTSGQPFVELGKRQVAESPVGKLYGDGGPDGDLRLMVGIVRGQLAKELDRWDKTLTDVEASEDYDAAAAESRRLAEYVAGAREAIAEKPGGTAAVKRDRAELLEAMAGFRRALSRYAAELEALDDTDAIEAAVEALTRAADRYDRAFAAFDA